MSDRILRKVCGGFVVMLSSIVAAGAAPQGGVEAAYVVLGPQGAVGRAVLRDAVQCPAIELDGTEQPMQIRARADAGVSPRFPVTVCEKLIPPETRSGIDRRTAPTLARGSARGDRGARRHGLPDEGRNNRKKGWLSGY